MRAKKIHYPYEVHWYNRQGCVREERFISKRKANERLRGIRRAGYESEIYWVSP